MKAQGVDLTTRAGLEWARLRDFGKGFWHPNNLDRRFPYKVPRTVTVQDARLGGSYVFFQLCIVLFIILVQILYNGGHIAFESPFGQVSFQVKRPTSSETPLSGANSYWNLSDSSRASAASGFLPTAYLPYCFNLTGPNRFCTSNDSKSPNYCTPMSCSDFVNTTVNTPVFFPNGSLQSNSSIVTNVVGAARRCNGQLVPLQTLRCRYEDEELIAPIVQEKSILIVSRVSWMYQDLQCDVPTNDNTPCVKLYKPQTSTQKYFTVSPEYFEIMFDHEVFTPTNGVTGKQQDAADAPLVFADGRTFYPANIDPRGNGSFYRSDNKPWVPGYYNILGRHSITIETLMEAAGIFSLDDPAQGLFDAGSTLRYTGVTVMLRIIYSNYDPWSFVTDAHPSYHYECKHGSTYAAVHSMTTQINSTTRLFDNRHGIKIVISQEGSLGAFTLVNFMFFVGGAVATLALASIVVDNIVLRFFIPAKVREILDLASATVVPVREDLNSYLKAVEENMGGEYEAPVTFWEVEKEWLDHQENMGKVKKRPEFKKTAVIELQKLVSEARMERGRGDTKTDTELVAVGALAFARTVSQEPPALERGPVHFAASKMPEARRVLARQRWVRAKAGVLAQVRAQQAAKGSPLMRFKNIQSNGYQSIE